MILYMEADGKMNEVVIPSMTSALQVDIIFNFIQ